MPIAILIYFTFFFKVLTKTLNDIYRIKTHQTAAYRA
jgi:hypothetical protein